MNIAHYLWITIPGDAANPTAVQFACSGSGPLRWVQDHAELITQNIKVLAFSNGISSLVARQYSIADDTNVTLKSFPGGNFYSATEDSKINVANGTMTTNSAGSAGAGCGFQAVGHGHVNLGAFKFGANTDASITGALACGDDYGVIDFSPATFSGPGVWGGLQYNIGAAELKRPPGGMPGSGQSTDTWSIVR